MFNVREGFGAQDDSLPLRIFQEPLPSGATSGKVLPRDQFRIMLEEYYTLRGWDTAGKPLTEQLRELAVV
jgi:aldehyde:ferredoxin oxidoreductase